MHIGANARVQWGAVMALLAGLTTVGAIGVAGAQDPVPGVELAAAGPRFLAVGPSRSSDPALRWKDASNATVFRKPISADLKDVPLGEVLLTSNGQAALVKRGTLDGLQEGTVSGRVTDSLSGQGIAVATVSVAGTGLSARSGDDGRYRITDVPVGEHTVRVVRIGYSSVTKLVTVLSDQEITLDFALTPRATQLEEVVAIGYGTTERRELTGAVS